MFTVQFELMDWAARCERVFLSTESEDSFTSASTFTSPLFVNKENRKTLKLFVFSLTQSCRGFSLDALRENELREFCSAR